MNKNKRLLSFEFHEFSMHSEEMIIVDESSIVIEKDNMEFLPFMLKEWQDSSRLNNWLNTRALPLNRSNYKSFIKQLGLHGRYQLLVCSFALSLNDTFWLCREDVSVSWEDINLFNHKFSKEIAMLAFGMQAGELNIKDLSTHSTPEFTTGGSLPKFWDRTGDKIFLYKGGIFDPMNEYLAHKILEFLEFSHVPYSLLLTRNRWMSKCELATSEDVGLLTVMEAIASFNPDLTDYSSQALERVLDKFGLNLSSYYEMVIADHIIRNTDRHLTNFGFSYLTDSFKVTGLFPLFDHGASFYENEREDCLADQFSFQYRALPYDVEVDSVLLNALNPDMKDKLSDLNKSLKFGSLSDVLDMLQDKRALPDSRRVAIEDWLYYIISRLLMFKPGDSINRSLTTFDRDLIQVKNLELW